MFYFFITLAGQPAAIQWAGMSLVTTAFAAIITPSPILTPANIVALSPIQTFFPMFIVPFEKILRFAGGILNSS